MATEKAPDSLAMFRPQELLLSNFHSPLKTIYYFLPSKVRSQVTLLKVSSQ
ncbi:hypothetical protein AVDCRST_MAG94-6243 [uncultured Leptolyngbya sp.]|uniref:Uncharacterized protein n=1 Tax=uncultured Leptolyngbya sp. TaxID=332963 RepID=A0A6J4PAP3_9CYAN|nr:hypothetical protein AVDCRST_MAG94-6243 [uncultured Leptolyngbya sp.]